MGAQESDPERRGLIVRRWRDLRQMLVQQLHMFESGRLSLKTAGVDISVAAIADLKRSIGEFDALILEAEAAAASA